MYKLKKLCHVKAGLILISSMLISQLVPAQHFNPSKFSQAMLTEHNNLRALHQNTPALTIDADLSQRAQAWAEHLLTLGKLQHGSSAERSGAGENLYSSSQSNKTYSQEQLDYLKQHYPNWTPPKPFTIENVAHAAALAWYKELTHYDYSVGNSANGQVIGHFTQVVWKGSTRLGCGSAHKTVGKMINTYVVCQYAPAGNVRGLYTANVMPRKPGAITPE